MMIEGIGLVVIVEPYHIYVAPSVELEYSELIQGRTKQIATGKNLNFLFVNTFSVSNSQQRNVITI